MARQRAVLFVTATAIGVWFGLAAPATSPVAPPPEAAAVLVTTPASA